MRKKLSSPFTARSEVRRAYITPHSPAEFVYVTGHLKKNDKSSSRCNMLATNNIALLFMSKQERKMAHRGARNAADCGAKL